MTVAYESISKISTVTGGMTHATELTECDRHGRLDGRSSGAGDGRGLSEGVSSLEIIHCLQDPFC